MRRCTLAARLSWCLLLLSSAALAQSFRYTQIDIGQGDSAVVVAPSGCAALIDGGPTGSGTAIKSYLRSIGVTSIDMAFNSHHHADHIGGLDEVDVGTNAVPIAAVYDRGGSYSSSAFTEYASHFSGRRYTLAKGQVLWLCNEVRFEVLALNGNGISSTDENVLSVILKISYGQFDALAGGDCNDLCEGTFAGQLGEMELYKVHHHGSRTSSSNTLLDRLVPTNAFISLGWNNSYGHPTAEALSRLQAHGTEIWMTEDPSQGRAIGAIELSSASGNTYTVTQAGTTRSYTSKNLPPSDTTPPTAPGALAATAASTSEIDLAWTASTDDVGVTGYRIQRALDGINFALVGTSTTTGFADLGLAAGTTYQYRVSAVDAAGNESAYSNVASATTAPPDTTPPTAPGALAASAGRRQISLTWTASTDDVGVTGYDVARSADGASFSPLASTTATSYVDSGLPDGATFWYRVTARDAAGNASAPSSVSATTVTPALAVTSPNGGESWAGGSTHDITWASSSVSSVKLEYSADNGATWSLIASSVAASTGRYAWTVPSAATTAARVRATDVAYGTPVDQSDATFTVTASSPAKVIINEVLANEPGSSTSGEFVEVVNVGGTGISIAGWTIRVAGSTKHTFASGTTLAAGGSIVVYGGASGIPPGVPNAVAASSGSLGLVNGGATVALRNGKTTVDTMTYSSSLAGVDGVSANRNPDATAGAGWVLHTSISAANNSPGTRVDGTPF